MATRGAWGSLARRAGARGGLGGQVAGRGRQSARPWRVASVLLRVAIVAALMAVLATPAAAASAIFTWVAQTPATHPSARFLAAMAYDSATGDMVLFGGQRYGFLGDTWTYNGTTWTQQHPATSPPARINAAMAYDPATGNVVLFGGFGSSGAALGDTWTYNESGRKVLREG